MEGRRVRGFHQPESREFDPYFIWISNISDSVKIIRIFGCSNLPSQIVSILPENSHI